MMSVIVKLTIKGEETQRLVAGGSFSLPTADTPVTIINDSSEVLAKVITFHLH